MKISTKKLLNGITPEEAIKLWGEDTYNNPLSEWCNKKFLEIITCLKKDEPWSAIEGALEIWEKYLKHLEEYAAPPNEGLISLKSAAWEWSILYFEKLFPYHYDLTHCVANIENGVIDFKSTPPRQHVKKIVDSLKAIRLGKPSPFSKEEKEEIKNRFRGHCEKQGQQETYEKYFGKSIQETKKFQ